MMDIQERIRREANYDIRPEGWNAQLELCREERRSGVKFEVRGLMLHNPNRYGYAVKCMTCGYIAHAWVDGILIEYGDHMYMVAVLTELLDCAYGHHRADRLDLRDLDGFDPMILYSCERPHRLEPKSGHCDDIARRRAAVLKEQQFSQHIHGTIFDNGVIITEFDWLWES